MIDEDLSVFVVADGMGGHRHGEVAAELVCKTIKYYLECSQDRSDVSWPFGYNFELSLDGNRLVTAIQLANRHVWRRADQDPECAGMGSTIAAALMDNSSAVVANVGDSRVYLYRGGRTRTVDRGRYAGRGNRPARRPRPLANWTSSPCATCSRRRRDPANRLNVHVREMETREGDLFLLTSDGLHAVIGDEAMRAVLAPGGDLHQIAGRMVEAARGAGGPDNIACVLLICAA